MTSFEKEEYYSVRDIVTKFWPFLKFLQKKWWLFVIAIVLGAISGILLYQVQKPKYEAVATFILEEKQSSTGGLSSIASQFGIDIGGMGGGSIFTGDNILDILKSKRIVEKILLSPVDSASSNSLSLADLYLDFSKLKKSWKNKPYLAQLSLSHLRSVSPLQDSVLNIIYDKVIKKSLSVDRTNKRGTIIKVQVIAENSSFARLMTERLVDEASKLYLSIKIGNALANISRLQRRSDSLLLLLNNRSFVAASIQPLDANPGIKTAAVPSEIAMRDKTVLATLYTEVTKNLETSKLLLSQQTPVLQILDTPGQSLYDNKKSLLFFLVIGSFVSLTIFLVVISISFFVRTA